MASDEADTVKGLLQGLEHALEALDRASAAATQLIEAQKTGKPLGPKTLEYYTDSGMSLSTAREAGARANRSRGLTK
jgi:hypothetical protein